MIFAYFVQYSNGNIYSLYKDIIHDFPLGNILTWLVYLLIKIADSLVRQKTLGTSLLNKCLENLSHEL